MARRIRVFRYVQELDGFLVADEFRRISDYLGLTEWHPVVWIGRLFTLDNDLGEHWFDNWSEREAIEDRAKAQEIDSADLMIVVPERFEDGRDGPCHSPSFRKAFWTDVLKSLELSYEVLFEEARATNARAKQHFPEDHIADLEERITAMEAESCGESSNS